MNNNQIKDILLKKQATNLKNLINTNVKGLIRFSEQDINAFLFACKNNCGYEIISLILSGATTYFGQQASKYITEHQLSENDEYNIDDFDEIGKEFFNFFYQEVLYKNGIKFNAAQWVFFHNDFKTVDLIKDTLFLPAIHDEFLSKKTERKRLFENITTKEGNKNPRSSKFRSNFQVVQRPARQFNKERERQLLKQLSTVIHFYIAETNQNNTPVETEMLHIRINNVSHLVISCNGGDQVSTAFQKIKSSSDLTKTLTQPIKITRDPEGTERTKRYQKNFEYVFSLKNGDYFLKKDTPNENNTDLAFYQNIIDILRTTASIMQYVDNYPSHETKQPTADKMIETLFNSKNSFLIFLDNSYPSQGHKDFQRHTEEYLVEFSNLIKQYNEKNEIKATIYTSIGGKKRPCFTCYATMYQNEINNHGLRPGYAWKTSCLSHQNIEDSKMTLLSLLKTPSHVTLRKNKKESAKYDSGSDEDEIKNSPGFSIK